MRTLIRALLLAGLLTVTGASSARADGDLLQLSTDGVTWTDSIRTPLFDPAVRWVPGDVREATFYLRNTRPDAGDLTVVLERSGDTELADTGDLTLSARADDGPWYAIDPGASRDLLESTTAGRDEARVELRASFAADSPNQSMVLATDLDLRLRLSDSSAGPDTEPLHPSLPDTGSALRPWLTPLALLLLGGGAVLVARRTEEKDDS